MRYNPLEEPIFLHETVFEDDFLGRRTFGKTLSAVLEQIEDPLVFALDGPWGSGKSHFLQRWVGAHTKQNGGKARTVYFDAFAYDYMNDPLVALISSIRDQLPKPEKGKLEPLLTAAYKLRIPILRVAAAIATSGASVVLNDVGDAAAEAINKEGTNYLEKFWAEAEGRHAAMTEFRSALSKLSNGSNSGENLRIIIVIDELDRCRPDFALETLEIVKHFFSVEGVHFVFGVNGSALENSVKYRYGSDIDAHSYLKKFFTHWIRLPTKIKETSSNINRVFAIQTAQNMNLPEKARDAVLLVLQAFERNDSLSLRDIKKIISDVTLIPQEKFCRFAFGYHIVAYSLLTIFSLDRKNFGKFATGKASLAELFSLMQLDDLKSLLRINDGKYNEEYSRPCDLVASLWAYILGEGESVFADGWTPQRDVASALGHHYDERQIPKTIIDDWLSLTELPQNRAAE